MTVFGSIFLFKSCAKETRWFLAARSIAVARCFQHLPQQGLQLHTPVNSRSKDFREKFPTLSDKRRLYQKEI